MIWLKDLSFVQQILHTTLTLPETSIAPKNWWWGDDPFLQVSADFQGLSVGFRGKCSSSSILHQAPYFAMRALGIQNFEQTFVVDVGRHAPWRQVKVMFFFFVGGVGMAQQKGNPSQLLKYTPQKTNILPPLKNDAWKTNYTSFCGVLVCLFRGKIRKAGISNEFCFSCLKLLPREKRGIWGGGWNP